MCGWAFIYIYRLLYVWMNDCVNGCTIMWIDGYLSRFVSTFLYSCASKWIFASINGYLCEWMNVYLNRWLCFMCVRTTV